MDVSSFGEVGTLPQTARRDFSAVGYDEAMRRARALVPVLRERAQAAEDARVLIARTSSCCTRPGCSASTSRRRSAAWS